MNSKLQKVSVLPLHVTELPPNHSELKYSPDYSQEHLRVLMTTVLAKLEHKLYFPQHQASFLSNHPSPTRRKTGQLGYISKFTMGDFG